MTHLYKLFNIYKRCHKSSTKLTPNPRAFSSACLLNACISCCVKVSSRTRLGPNVGQTRVELGDRRNKKDAMDTEFMLHLLLKLLFINT